MNFVEILEQVLMLFPVKNMVHHIEGFFLIKFQQYHGRDKIQSLTVSELWKGGWNGVESWSHFTSELFDEFILWKSSVKIKVDLLTLTFTLVERVWFERFHDQLGPDLISQRVWYPLSDMVDKNTFVSLFKIFEIWNDIFFPFFNLAADLLVICKVLEDLIGEIVSPESVLIVNGWWTFFGRLHKKRD